MSDMTPDAWVSIRPHLRALAEAAPAAFLDCVEADLDRADQPISSIMRCVGDAGISRECLRTELLWALEALAWSPRYFSRVAEVIFRLCAFETNDNYLNNPQNTAAALFRAWLPSTTLDVLGRMDVLRRLAPRYRLPAIEVCKSLIASGPRFASRTLMPRWLPVEGDYDVVTNHDLWNAGRAASNLLLDIAPLNDIELRDVLDVIENLLPEDLERLRTEVERWSGSANDKAKATFAKFVREELAQLQYRLLRRERDEPDLEGETLASILERMLDRLQPDDLRLRHLWLFEQDHIRWPALERDEALETIGWRERDALVQSRRQSAVSEIEASYGSEALYEFSTGLEHPQIAARVLAGADATIAQRIYWASRAMEDEGGGEKSDLFLAQALFLRDEKTLTELVAALDEKGLLNEENSQARLGRSLPNHIAGWRLAERIGGPTQEAYWSSVHIHILLDEEGEEADFVARRLLDANRPRSAYQAVCTDPAKLSPRLWLEILQGIARGIEPDGPAPDRWHLVRILQELEASDDISISEIAAIELPFASLLSNYGEARDRPIWAIHRIFMSDPAEDVGLLKWMYKRDDGGSDPEIEELTPEHRQLRANIAYRVFHEWSEIPGTQDDGVLDNELFRKWSCEMLRLSEEHGRLHPALSCLADCLAQVAKRRGFDAWLPDVVLEFLDQPDLGGFRRSFGTGVRNARGVTTRGAFDGGAQERALAQRYRELAQAKSIAFPRVAAMLEDVAASYDREARRHDEEAQLGERWHP